MCFAKALVLISCLAMTSMVLAETKEFPNDVDWAGDRVECDLSGHLYYEMITGDSFDATASPITYGPLHTGLSGLLSGVVLAVDIDQTWIGDIVIDLYYDENGNGVYDAGPVSALCRPNLAGCAYDGCCGCSGDISGVYTFGDDAAESMGEPNCPPVIPNGCYLPAVESPSSFAGAFNGLQSGGDFYLEIADGAGGDETFFNSWGVFVVGAPVELMVMADGTGDVPTIQNALDIIAPGGTVYLADGVYMGPGNWNLNFWGKACELRSQSLNPVTCIIDGGAPPISLPRVASSSSGIPKDVPMGRDFGDWGVIMFGEGPGTIVNGITFTNFATDGYGAAIYIFDGSPTIENCHFKHNYSSLGGPGVFVHAAGSPHITSCRFENNLGQYGGAIAAYQPSNPIIDDCVFHQNEAFWGGAFYQEEGINADIQNSVFSYNNAENGGAFMSYENLPGFSDIRHCTFSENSATLGGAIFSDTPNRFWFDTIAFSYQGGAFIHGGGGDLPDIACTNIFGNVGGDWTGALHGMQVLSGNMEVDPQFCGNLGTWDYRLQSDSQCAWENNSCSENIGAFGAECGASASAETSWSEVKSLY